MKTALCVVGFALVGLAGSAIYILSTQSGLDFDVSAGDINSLQSISSRPVVEAGAQPPEMLPGVGRVLDSNARGPRPAIKVEAAEYDFGPVRTQSGAKPLVRDREHTFQITNSGKGPLVIDHVKLSCEKCMRLRAFTKEISPGGSGTVEVEWGVQVREDHFRQSLMLFTNDPEQPALMITLFAQVLQDLTYEPRELVFSSLSAKDTSTAEMRFCAYFMDDFDILHWELLNTRDASFFDLEVLPCDKLPDLAKSGRIVRLTVKPGLPLGPFRQTIRVATNMPEQELIEIPVSGRIDGDLWIIGKPTKWDPTSGVLRIGPISSESGATEKLSLMLRGKNRDQIHWGQPKVSPPELQVSLSEPKDVGPTQKTRQVGVTIEIPKGAPPMNYMGGPGGRLGEILLPTGHEDFGDIRIRVQFAVEG